MHSNGIRNQRRQESVESIELASGQPLKIGLATEPRADRGLMGSWQDVALTFRFGGDSGIVHINLSLWLESQRTAL